MAIVLLAAPQSTPGPLTVTVLPFESLSSDTADDWVGRGVAETPAVDLEQVDGVVLRPSEVGDADWRVSGACRRLGDQVRITARIVELASNTVRGTARVDGDAADTFTLQDRLGA